MCVKKRISLCETIFFSSLKKNKGSIFARSFQETETNSKEFVCFRDNLFKVLVFL